MSLNDIRIICSPFSVGKALYMCRRATLICLHTCQHPHQLFSTAMHEPCHHFHIPNYEPVTYIWIFFLIKLILRDINLKILITQKYSAALYAINDTKDNV